MQEERLQKVIALSGYCSRRKAEELISKGQVYVNGEMVTELGTKVEGNETIVVEGVTLNKDTRKEYYLLNKPRGYICSVSDDKGRKVKIAGPSTPVEILGLNGLKELAECYNETEINAELTGVVQIRLDKLLKELEEM